VTSVPRSRRRRSTLSSGVLAGCLLASPGATKLEERPPELRVFLEAASTDEKAARAALATLAAGWRDGYAPLLVDLARFMPSAQRGRETSGEETPGQDDGDRSAGRSRPPGLGPGDRAFPAPGTSAPVPPAARIRERLLSFLEKQTGQRFGDDLRRWRRWYWNRPYEPHPHYAAFKSGLYANVDPRMSAFFPPGGDERIRLDEVDWGGVKVDGIPPLDHPKHVAAGSREAAYLKDGHVVFGLFLNGEARAYPKRILAWHEMARDRLGGVALAIVYCTLCGTVIPYGAEVGGVVRTFGTSGLLYRSNKLMYDAESMSLWSTVEGRPVLGALASRDLTLTAHPVVTTIWKEWREAHPETTVLSLDTGFARDYGEGAAYREYFASDRLMFEVPQTDDRLRPKDEVLALRVGEEAVALAVRFLEKNRVFALEAAGRRLLVLTSPEGANRVYDVTAAAPGPPLYSGYRETEDALLPEDGPGAPLPRVPARRAFWFGWAAQYPDTRLVK
jgi:hypothetical protein